MVRQFRAIFDDIQKINCPDCDKLIKKGDPIGIDLRESDIRCGDCHDDYVVNGVNGAGEYDDFNR